jgi:hypothetical protein
VIRARKWQGFTVTPLFVHSYEHFFFLYCLILSVCLFVSSLIFQFFICVVYIRPDLWPACGDMEPCLLPTTTWIQREIVVDIDTEQPPYQFTDEKVNIKFMWGSTNFQGFIWSQLMGLEKFCRNIFVFIVYSKSLK